MKRGLLRLLLRSLITEKCMTRPSTYFEQIPVELVKRFAKAEDVKEEEHADGQAADTPANVIFESSSKKTDPYSVRPDSLSEKHR